MGRRRAIRTELDCEKVADHASQIGGFAADRILPENRLVDRSPLVWQADNSTNELSTANIGGKLKYEPGCQHPKIEWTMEPIGLQSRLYGHAKFVQKERIHISGALDAFVERGVDVAGVGTGAQ
jgi:hypothetical protein